MTTKKKKKKKEKIHANMRECVTIETKKKGYNKQINKSAPKSLLFIMCHEKKKKKKRRTYSATS